MAWGPVIVGIVHPHLGGFAGSFAVDVKQEINTWYKVLSNILALFY
jgi:hypothetical protein